MKRTTNFQAVFAAIFLLLLGWRFIETGAILPYSRTRYGGLPPPSSLVHEPYVPLVGGIFVFAGLYILYRVVFKRNNK